MSDEIFAHLLFALALFVWLRRFIYGEQFILGYLFAALHGLFFCWW